MIKTLAQKALAAANRWYEKRQIPSSDRNMITALTDMYEAGFKSGKYHTNKEEIREFEKMLEAEYQKGFDADKEEQLGNLKDWFNAFMRVQDFVIELLGEDFVKMEFEEGQNDEQGMYKMIKHLIEKHE